MSSLVTHRDPEAERRTRAVIESQEFQIVADIHAKEAALAVAQVNLSYTRIVATGDGTIGERLVRPGQLVSPGTQVMSFVCDHVGPSELPRSSPRNLACDPMTGVTTREQMTQHWRNHNASFTQTTGIR